MKWIKVIERLPDTDICVLALLDSSNIVIISYTDDKKNNLQYWKEPGYYGYTFEKKEVTHWMPLPEPTKDTT